MLKYTSIKKILLFIVLLFNAHFAIGQDDIVKEKNQNNIVKSQADSSVYVDSLYNKDGDISENKYAFFTSSPVPKRAAMYSALLPGLGQAYNKQYWKIAIVYGGLAGAGYLINQQYTAYNKYRKAFIYATDGNPNTIDSLKYSPNQLFNLQKESRTRLDKLGVYTTVFYALNIVDALVSSHLRNFDVSKSISMQAKPVVGYNYLGFALVATFKNRNF